MTSIQKLIERLEKASGDSRELDRDIAIAAGWERKVVSQNEDDYWRKGEFFSWSREDSEHPPYFTSSIDAALTLVPQNTPWNVGSILLPGATWRAVVGRNQRYIGKHKRDAIALCIAALRAIAEKKEGA
jgi:hypothetical protein